MKTLKLSNGHSIPALGLGTWKSAPGQVRQAVVEAVKVGYRHIDCAWIYDNEVEIGEALAELFEQGIVKRQELWVTSKLWNNRHFPVDVEPAVRESLSNLGLEYLDLYLIHWPVVLRPDVPFPKDASDFLSLDEVPLSKTWAAMESLVDKGLCRSIGVSNFSVKKLQALISQARIQPVINQIELHPYLQQAEMLNFCQRAGVALTAYSPLGSKDRPERLRKEDDPILLDDQTVAAIAHKHRVTAAQILIAWAIARGTSVIPKSVNPARLKQNFEALLVQLEAGDMEALQRLDRRRRYVDGALWAAVGGPYSVASLWDE